MRRGTWMQTAATRRKPSVAVLWIYIQRATSISIHTFCYIYSMNIEGQVKSFIHTSSAWICSKTPFHQGLCFVAQRVIKFFHSLLLQLTAELHWKTTYADKIFCHSSFFNSFCFCSHKQGPRVHFYSTSQRIHTLQNVSTFCQWETLLFYLTNRHKAEHYCKVNGFNFLQIKRKSVESFGFKVLY